MSLGRPWFQISEAEGNEFSVALATERCEDFSARDVQAVRSYYRQASAAKLAKDVRRRVQEVITASFIAMRKEDRYVFVDAVPLARMSMPGQEVALEDLARYATDVHNLKGFDALLCEALRRFSRPFLTWTPPSKDASLWIDLAANG